MLTKYRLNHVVSWDIKAASFNQLFYAAGDAGLSGSPFTLAGPSIARDALIAEAGLDYAVAANAFLGVSWSGQFADQSHTTNAINGNSSGGSDFKN